MIKVLLFTFFPIFSGGALYSFFLKNWYFIRFSLIYALIFALGYVIGNRYVVFLLLAAFSAYLVRKEPGNLVYYYLVLLSAFPISIYWVLSIPGISSLFVLNHSRLLVLVLFFPLFYRIVFVRQEKIFAGSSSYTGIIDRLVFAFLLLSIVLNFRHSNITSTLREAMHIIVDAWIPYFVISRSIKSVNTILLIFLFTAVVVAMVAIMETVFLFRFYDYIVLAMGDSVQLRNFRGGGLRVYSSMAHPLALGFFLSVPLVIAFNIRKLVSCPIYAPWILGIIIVLGINATGSRSPMVTSIVGLLVVFWWSLGRRFVQNTAWVVIFISVIFFYWLFSFGIEWLVSFDADGKSGNFYYRYELLLNSADAIKSNLWFGAYDYWNNPQLQNSMQGEGIIDITNVYLWIILNRGVIGLGLFISIWFVVLKGLCNVRAPEHESALLMGMCITMLLMMFICGLAWSIPNYMWILLAMISGFFKQYDRRV